MEKQTITTLQGEHLKAEIHPNYVRLYVKSVNDGWVWVDNTLGGLISEAHEIQAHLQSVKA